MNNINLFHDFTFEQWTALSYADKREIWNHFWSPYESQKGFTTRKLIVGAFCKKHPEITESAVEIGFGYFGYYVGCIYVIANGAIKVPKHFADITINKGTLVSNISESAVHVKWRDVGGNCNFELKKREFYALEKQ